MYAESNLTGGYPPPKVCPFCGNEVLEVSMFGRGREWEISCFMCGRIWWTRRRKIGASFKKYRHSKENDDFDL